MIQIKRILILGWLVLMVGKLYAQPFDMAFSGFQMPDSVVVGQDFTITGEIINIGTINVPAGILMNFLVSQNASGSVPQNGIPNFSFGSNSPILKPGDTLQYSKDIEADDDYFLINSKNIVTIWPKTPSGNDVDSSNNVHVDSIYVVELEEQLVQSSELHNQRVNVFPNPITNEVVYVDLPTNNDRSYSIFIYDLNGRLRVLSQFENVRNGAKEIDISKLPLGTYYMSVLDEKNKLIESKSIFKVK